MKLLKTGILLLVLLQCLTPISALAATEDEARALMTECGIGETVADSDNLMGISIKDVHLDVDGDVYIQWQFANEIMKNNLVIAYIQMRFFDPDALTLPYTAFTINADKTLGINFKADDSISFLDYVHLNHEVFNPKSGVIFMYFNGSGESAPKEFFTRPLVFTFYVDSNGPHAVETTPRYAPETMISAFSN